MNLDSFLWEYSEILGASGLLVLYAYEFYQDKGRKGRITTAGEEVMGYDKKMNQRWQESEERSREKYAYLFE